MTKVVAVVPVRKGSQRVKSKNTRPFADTTLLDLKLKVLKELTGVSDIIVNTDCDTCKEIARTHGVSIYERDEYFASSAVSNDVHWRHIAEVTDTEVLMMAQTTSPMIKVSTYQQAIKEFLELDAEGRSLNSVTPEKKFLWRDGQPINYDPNKTPKSQDLPNIVSLNFAITLIDRSTMLRKGNVVGEHPRFIELDKIQSVDIDDMIDFNFAEYIYRDLSNRFIFDSLKF